jgi:5-oxoprolinase (ATP-hydrolysing) subunit C
MGLIVINPGVSATVQDRGRAGYREWGIPLGGAFDRGSAALANALLGNAPGCAVIELTLFGGTYEARIPLAVALAGASMTAAIARAGGPTCPLVVPQSVALAPGDRLILGGAAVGARTYLAVKGGWLTRPTLGSRSREESLKPGDVLDAEPGAIPVRRLAEPGWGPPDRAPIRIIDGPDSAQANVLESWTDARFRVGRQADRMGLRLEGPDLPVESPPGRISTPVAPGAVQIAGGQAIILGVACGTMGGYPHVAHVIAADLDRVGQLRPGDTITFQRVTLDEARALDRAARKSWADRLRGLAVIARDDLAASTECNPQPLPH